MPEQTTVADRLCSYEGCMRKLLAKGFCSAHYERQRNGWPLDKPIRRFGQKHCSVENCDRPHKSGGYCQMHYLRWLYQGTPGEVEPRGFGRQAGRPIGHTTIQHDGYRNVKTENGWVMEHRLVMAAVLGRDLFPWENVHHVNGDRADNRTENLEVWVRGQPAGQRLEDIIDFVVTNYPEAVDAARAGRAQLELIRSQEATDGRRKRAAA